MPIRCPKCGRTISVPDERASNPRLKVKCACGQLFAISEAQGVATSPASAPPTPPSRTSGTAPAPSPAGVARAAPVRAPAPAPPPGPAASVPAERLRPRTGSAPVPWKRCVNHPQTRSESLCPACLKGYCQACENKVQSASICPSCDGLCVSTAQYEERQAREKQQGRSMMQEVGTIVAYPLVDSVAEVPLGGSVAHAQAAPQPAPTPAGEESEEGEERAPGGQPGEASPSEEYVPAEEPVPATMKLAFALALLWKLAYTPVALTVAAMSRSVLQTLNPLIGVGTIARMGAVYWQALAVYSVVAAVQWSLGFGLGFVPMAGGLVKSFVDAYAYLAIGCTLGLAVFKKAKELGLE